MPTRCPVCGKAGLPSDVVECPQCNADLEVFQLLEALQEVPPPLAGVVQAAATTDEAQATEGTAMASKGVRPAMASPVRLAAPVALVSLLLGMGAGYLVPRSTPPLAPLEARLAHIAERLPRLARRDDLVALDGRLSRLEQGLRHWTERASIRPPTATPLATTEGGLCTQRLIPGDTLWGIAKRHYGTGHLYPVLLALNPGLGIHFSPGAEIRLPADRVAAQRLLAGVVAERKGRRVLRYPVVADDTWERISRRLYGHTRAAAGLRHLNGGSAPEPGTSIWVPLTD
jgi:LysM domain